MTRNKPKLHPDFIHPDALEITENLQNQGFTTYLVGGCVRDLLAGIQPKDFDIATTAHPRQIKKVIRDAYIIGKRFRLVLVKRGKDLFEVATFRREATEEELKSEDKPIGDNIFGSAQEDAARRDFTFNAIFYDPIQDELVDYCGGLDDVKSHTLRMIGDPEKRLIEDPIRILRALRFSHRLEFNIESQLREAMRKYSDHLPKSALPRRREELLKILRLKEPSLALMEAYDLNILSQAFPSLAEIYEKESTAVEFNSYMSKIHKFVLDPENPAELFGYLMLAYYRSMAAPDPFQKVFANDFLKDEKIKKMMSFELGMFNVEQAMVAKALEFQSRLKKNNSPSREFDYYAEAIPLGLMMAKADFVLSSEKFHEWESALDQFVAVSRKRTRKPHHQKPHGNRHKRQN